MFYRRIGEGQPFIVLHGLYGASDNWVGFARNMPSSFGFYLPDMRNHGQSEHADEFNYAVMCDDVYEWITECKIEKPVIIGHSMGGKVAMELAKRYPQLLSALIVLDISPVSYNEFFHENLLNHQQIINSMQAIDLSVYTIRNQVENELFSYLKNNELSGFLMKNLARRLDGAFYWRLNLESLAINYSRLQEGIVPDDYRCSIPSLFVKAQSSGYITELDRVKIAELYPASKFVEVSGANHWLYVSHSEELRKEICSFLHEYLN